MSRTKAQRVELSAPSALGESFPSRLSIAAVERDTGIPKETLRVWERRYGFPSPGRTAQDERFYTAEDLERLRLVTRLIAAGHRPGKVLPLSLEDLVKLAPGPKEVLSEEAAESLALLVANRVEDFEARLAGVLARDGLKAFVLETAPQINRAVGDAWARGGLHIHQEHVFSEIMTGLLRAAIAPVVSRAGQPRILLTTFPLEPHAIGLLLAEAMFAISGCACISLGPQTPTPDIILAAAELRADIVALSFSNTLPANRVLQGLEDLRAGLPASAEIWAGGSAECLGRVRTPGIRILRELERVPDTIADWRSRTQSA